MDSVRKGEGGKIWENGIETCKISCMKRVASPGSMHDTGCLGLVPWDDPEGWNGEGGGRRVQDVLHNLSLFILYLFELALLKNCGKINIKHCCCLVIKSCPTLLRPHGL